MYKLLSKLDKTIPLPTLLKMYLNKEISINEKTKDSSQIIFVVGTKDYNAKIYLYDKDNYGNWTKILSVDGYVGKNGITNNKKEGDLKTPSGIYGFDMAFGIAENPGTKLVYKQISNNDYWVDDPNSKYYNQWVDISKVDKDFKSAEHLSEYKTSYKYGLVINYNTKNIIKGKGSAIFFHVSTNGPTHGCVSVDEEDMIKILKVVKKDTKLIIAKDKESISEVFKQITI